ncbi:MAG TPA: D-2-hydroxyacid dehydrogenase, partial [Burkholderiales bacterium]|nr:D-2-hydroxyacid dehydrogenase [Burkholderiales bacterium]
RVQWSDAIFCIAPRRAFTDTDLPYAPSPGMTALLVSHQCNIDHGAELRAFAAQEDHRLELIVLPPERDARLSDADCARVATAFFSSDVFPAYSRQFFSVARKAANLKWLHVFNAGVDHPIYGEMLERGVRLTTSSGSAAAPIAQTAIAALLMLARNFPHWIAAQRKHAWEPMLGRDVPPDLAGQTVLILGLGHIGKAFAHIARALGLHLIGVRRRAGGTDDAVDELHAPDKLADLLPRAQWLVVACPLTAETRGVIDAAALARLPRGARLINVARGEIVSAPALVAALQSGYLAGAYLDVFEKEPLPSDSPLWDMPNVLLSPHNCAAASGNDARVYALFRDNLRRWMRGAPLLNEVPRVK